MGKNMKVIIQYTLNVDRSKYPELSPKEIHDQVSEEMVHMINIGEERVFNRLKDEQNLRTYKNLKAFLEREGE
jgi:hypothetical protein